MPIQSEAETSKPTDAVVRPGRGKRRRSMILPEAYDERVMPSLQLTRSSRWARRIGKLLTVMLMVGFVVIAFAPWQQFVRGTGSVIAYTPTDRMQTIEAPTKGRIVEWAEDIYENVHVSKGDLIARIQDLDESYLDRLQSQLEASEQQVENFQSQIAAGQRNLQAAEALTRTLETQVRTYRSVREQTVAAAEADIEAARQKIEAERQKLQEARAALTQAEADYFRQRTLFEEEIAAEVKFQEAEQKYLATQAKVAQAEANIQGAEAELDRKLRDRDAKERKAQADVEYAQSTLDKAQGDFAKSDSELAKYRSELQKAQKELLEAEVKLSRQRSQTIKAPFDGFLTQIMPNQGSAVLKEGDPIAVIVPDTSDRAVQIWLDGNDAPLVDAGRHVRLQFEGWPAVQFAGWPSVAVGTFGGTVVSVDATDDGKGQFRVLVRPDPDTEEGWPNERYLRQGVRTNGWVLLEQVPLWYEIWRNMNGFPPAITADAGAAKEKSPKVPKLPKP